MYIIIWQYTVHSNYRDAFIEHYHSDGEWVKLFQQSPDYVETEFFQLENDTHAFITVDKWLTSTAYERFLKENAKAYQRIDNTCEEFTREEILIGKYFIFE